ncbi:MAG: 2'-5' RNA ligase family protein [Pyrinomonadaceae bacterium]
MEYALDTSQWEDWKKEYKFGVVLIFPPDPLLSRVNDLRAKYDPKSQAFCDAHISLTVPLPRKLTDEYWRELEKTASAIEPFPVKYGPLKHYLPHPGVCLEIEPQDKLNDLRLALESATVFNGVPERKYPFSAHMTIAEFITEEQTLLLMDELETAAPKGTFYCTNVSYAVPDDNFHFTERLRLALGDH